MSKLRVSVEWLFKDITNLWQYLKFGKALKILLQPIGIFYIVAADLTNVHTILRDGGETAEYFNCFPPSLAEYTAPRVYADGDDAPGHGVHVADEEGAMAALLAEVIRDAHENFLQPNDLVDDEGALHQALVQYAEHDEDNIPNAVLDGFGNLIVPEVVNYVDRYEWEHRHPGPGEAEV